MSGTVDFQVDNGRVSKFEMTNDGYMKAWVTVARTGELEYFNSDAGGARKEIVTRNTLLGEKSLRTIKGLPVTHGHPVKNGKNIALDNTNAKDYQRGSTLESVAYEPPYFSIVTSITDGTLIESIKAGNNGASLGYKPDKQQIDSGSFEQLDRDYNHLALGFPPEFARGGEELGVQFDSTNIFDGEQATPNQLGKSETNLDQVNDMTTVQLNFDSGASYPVDPNVKSLIETERQQKKTQIDSLTTTNSELEAKVSDLQGELDKAKGELEASNQKLKEAQNVDHSGEITARMNVWGEVLPSLQQIDSKAIADYSLPVIGVKKLYLEKVKNVNCDSRSDDNISGLYEGHRPNPQQDSKNWTNNQYDHLGGGNHDGGSGGLSEIEKARQKRAKEQSQAYMGGTK